MVSDRHGVARGESRCTAPPGASGEPVEPIAETENIWAPAAEELAAEPYVQPGATGHVGHERVAGDQVAMGQRRCEGVEVGRVAHPRPAQGQLMIDRPRHLPPYLPRAAIELRR